MTILDPSQVEIHAGSLARFIFFAQDASLDRQGRLASLDLRSLTDSVASLDVYEVITRAEVTLTIDGASTVEIDLRDPDQYVERSGILDPDDNGRLNGIEITVDLLKFRLAAARRRSWDTLTLVFEDIAKALLDEHSSHLHASRNKVTRAQFIGGLIAEAEGSGKYLTYISPQESVRQPIKHPKLPHISVRDSGFDAGVSFKIKGANADAGQIHEVAVAMTVADELGVTDRPRLAMLVAGIGESAFRPIPNSQGSGYEGVFQADPKNLARTDTQGQATYFLKGGKGFQAGGAIKAAADHPDWSPGMIATKVEASGQPASFYDVAPPGQHYNARKEADAIMSAWKSGPGANATVTTYKSFEFTRGLPGQKETSWQAATRLAQEVNWRFFAVASYVCFVDDDWLISRPAQLKLDAHDSDGNWRVPPGLLSMPTYDVDHGKLAQNVTLAPTVDAWGVLPGDVVSLANMGPISGAWITETFVFSLTDGFVREVTLTKPVPAAPEPSPDPVTVDAKTHRKNLRFKQWAPVVEPGAMRPGTTLHLTLESFLMRIGRAMDDRVHVTTGTNHNKLTINGSVSDHFAGNAADCGTSANGQIGCERICFHALRLCGMSVKDATNYAKNGIGQAGVALSWEGARVQVFWRSNDPGIGNHYDHVHVGVVPG